MCRSMRQLVPGIPFRVLTIASNADALDVPEFLHSCVYTHGGGTHIHQNSK